MSDDIPQLPLLQEFYQELIRASMHFRNLGLRETHRASAFLVSGLAVADILSQADGGRTLNEEEFVEFARMIHQSVRKGLGPGGPPS